MKVAIIMGSDSDWGVMKAAADILNEFDINYEAKVVSAHRTPDDMVDFAKQAVTNEFDVIMLGLVVQRICQVWLRLVLLYQ